MNVLPEIKLENFENGVKILSLWKVEICMIKYYICFNWFDVKIIKKKMINDAYLLTLFFFSYEIIDPRLKKLANKNNKCHKLDPLKFCLTPKTNFKESIWPSVIKGSANTANC